MLLGAALMGAVAGTASAAGSRTAMGAGACKKGTGNCTGMSASGQCTQMSGSGAATKQKAAAKTTDKATGSRR